MERLGIPIDIDPINALLGAVREAAGNVEFLRARVQQLEEVFGANHLGDETARVVVQLYNEERDRLARTAKLAIDAGVETQLVRIEQQKAQAIVAAVEAIIESPDLGLDPERRQRAYTVAARELRALEALVFDDTESPKPLRLKLVSDDPGEDTDG